MGEAKRRARALADSPRPIEEAWRLFLAQQIRRGGRAALPPPVEEFMRHCFFGGAAMLFEMMTDHGLDEGAEPTDADMRRMDRLAAEVREFARQYFGEMPTAGSG